MTRRSLREKLSRVIFYNDTKAGHRFDIAIVWMIVFSVSFVILDSVDSISPTVHQVFKIAEWVFTILFTIEYIFRIYSAPDRWKYITSFFGIVDFLAIIPSYVGIFIIGTQHLLIVRILRLLRIFRIFQMGHFVREGSIVASALRASQVKIIVFLVFVIIASILMGALMYMVEADYNPHMENIPDGIYWAIVTLTTVGYGDTIPVTALGKFLASIVMILGYGVIAVPTGIVTAEISSRVLAPKDRLKIKCSHCGDGDHLQNSYYCHNCGTELPGQKKR
ncbi:MAG TPA: ion transporter [Saprospiraceae bacterium]|nr:ion transporter [Saprospiraceae bacterium]